MKQLSIFLLDPEDSFSLLLDNGLGKQISYSLIHYQYYEKAVKDLYLKPDIIILGDSVSDQRKKELVLRIKRIYSQAELIIIAKANSDINVMRDLFKNGAYDYIIKDNKIQDNLLNSILSIHTLNSAIKKNRLFRKMGWI